ncbi:hypothetical protein MVEN_01203800 [Mycena venus]|uniref:Uncharacterized protein n=1 Tax=Mycena venus TaxID=2733690 RepID=A0A8H6Y1M2_9AGAR|nr:hypothetical protein MVEN_01203800 [Mycena venus]
MTGQGLTYREMISYGVKPGEPWAEQRRELERAFDRAGRPDHNGLSNRSLSMSSGLPSTSHAPAPAAQRQHSASSAGYGYARQSGYGSAHLQRPEYASPRRAAYPQEGWMMRYRDHGDPSQRSGSVFSRTSSPAPSYASRYSYDRGYAPSSSYNPTYQSHSGSSRYGGYGFTGSESSTNYTPRPIYETEEEDYHVHAPSSVTDSEPHFGSGYAEATFIVEPSDSGSETSYSGEHSPYDDSESERGGSDSGYSGSEGDDAYSEGDEYDDYDGGGYSEDGDYSDGGYYSD